MEAALRELQDAGTMERRGDGAWGFTEAAWRSQACASRTGLEPTEGVTRGVTVTLAVTLLVTEV